MNIAGRKMKQAAICLVYIATLCITIVNCRPAYLHVISEAFSKLNYKDDLVTSERVGINLIFLFYCIVAFYWTRKAALQHNLKGILFWTLNWAIDVVVLPLGALLLVWRNNFYYDSTAIKELSSLDNMFMIGLLYPLKQSLVNYLSKRKNSSINANVEEGIANS